MCAMIGPRRWWWEKLSKVQQKKKTKRFENEWNWALDFLWQRIKYSKKKRWWLKCSPLSRSLYTLLHPLFDEIINFFCCCCCCCCLSSHSITPQMEFRMPANRGRERENWSHLISTSMAAITFLRFRRQQFSPGLSFVCCGKARC